MAKISIGNSGNYTTSGGGDYFTLKDDGDTAEVRFLYDQADGSDMDYYLVHEVMIEGKKKYVNCLAVDEEGRMHQDDCPLCKSGNKPKEKLFLQLYDENDKKLKVWERGQQFVAKIVSFINRYNSLVAQPFEIERRGKKGDQKTTYELFPCEKDNATLNDFPEKQNIIGTLVIEANKDDMLDIIDGVYRLPGSDTQNNAAANNNQSSASASRRQRGGDAEPRRRTRRTADEDAF